MTPMTPSELLAKGYSLEWAAWGVSVYRTTDGSPATGNAPVNQVAAIHFQQPLQKDEACARGWDAARIDFVKRRLDG